MANILDFLRRRWLLILIGIAALAFLLVCDYIPWRRGTVATVYADALEGKTAEYVAIEYDELNDGKTVLQPDAEKAQELMDYICSLKIRACRPVEGSDEVLTIRVHTERADAENVAESIRVQLIDDNKMTIGMNGTELYRRGHTYILTDGIDIEYILSLFEGDEVILSEW